jgi:hypothetical protein
LLGKRDVARQVVRGFCRDKAERTTESSMVRNAYATSEYNRRAPICATGKGSRDMYLSAADVVRRSQISLLIAERTHTAVMLASDISIR